MFRIRVLSLFVLIVMAFSTIPTFAQQPVQAQPTPVQQPSVADDENWDDRFGLAFGTASGSMIHSMVEFRGELYAAGSFKLTEFSYNMSTIARWNGRRWAAVGLPDWSSGAVILAMFIRDDQLYVTGQFSKAGGVPANNIARWDGNQWSALGAGIKGTGLDLEWYNNELYVGGTFTQTGSLRVNNIARWNGTTWNDVAGGLTFAQSGASVEGMVATNDGLYVVGGFNQAGTTPVTSIARWNGTIWSSMGAGVAGLALDITQYNNQLYVAGMISPINGTPNSVLRWDGSAWVQFTTPITHAIWGFQHVDQDLYFITISPDINNPRAYKWNGTMLTPISPAINTGGQTSSASWDYDQTTSVIRYQGKLHIAGDVGFRDDPYFSYNILRLDDDSRWHGIGEGVYRMYDSHNSSMIYAQNHLFLGGLDGKLMGSIVDLFGAFNGATWIPELQNKSVEKVASDGTTVYAATQNQVYQRIGTQWNMLAGTFNGEIKHMTVANGTLYVFGNFTSVDSLAVNHVAKWNGSQWSALGNGIFSQFSPTFSDVAVSGSMIYVAGLGLRTSANGADTSLLRWNGTQWQSLGVTDTYIDALAVDSQGGLYAGGQFTSIAGVPATNLAYYNGQWSALGSGVVGNQYAVVSTLKVDGATLYDGGQFSQAGTKQANNIATYNNGTWATLGSGVNGRVAEIALDPQKNVYLFGAFTKAGGKTSSQFAMWHPNGIPNTNPVAVADFVTTVRNQAINIAVLTNDYDLDGDMFALASLTQPAHGTAVISGTNVIYTPTVNYTGTDSFTYTISDGRGGTSSANVTITITKSLNHAPTAINDGAVTAFQTPVTIAVLSNDTDLDADTLSITSVTQPMHGTAVISGTSVVYTPALGYIGNDSFSYTISDGKGGTSTAMVMILVDGPPQYRVYLPMITR